MKTIFIAASGSGGHLFPAVYVADALRKIDPSLILVGIGSGRPLEKKIFSDWNLPYEIIETVGIKNRGVSGFCEFLFSIPQAIYQTAKLFYKYKPSAVIGMGGYATVFPVIYAWAAGISTWIHEAELKPGLANFILCFFSQTVSVAFEQAKLPTKSNRVFTGHPVRQGLAEVVKNKVNNEPVKNLLILGGSQGAAGLDQALPHLSKLFLANKINIRHQCRKNYSESVTKAYKEQGVDAEVVEFIDDMPSAYNWADMVIARSGAGSIMEIGVVNIPAVLVPFPFAQADHQTHNANILVEQGKALLVSEKSANFISELISAVSALLDKSNYNNMLNKPLLNRTINAAEQIAKGVLAKI
jgi:UDP-N-acetylglucosamine--N-acetylmuramyl-(pentapeptide) pyrophosphoryl-undecaprenol N-acetylglucosamine transferase